MRDLVCELVGVNKRYGQHPILTNFNLGVVKGETVGIRGRSGSGKSTLLNIIGLLEPFDSGEMRLFGELSPPVGSRAARRMLRYRLGYLFQNFALIDGESVDYNLRVAQSYARARRNDKKASRDEALSAVGLPNIGRRKIYELSGGEQQRIAIARLMLKPCDLILADEPTGSLDPANRDAVLALLDELNSAGKTVIVVSHDDQVTAACQRLVELPDGQVPQARLLMTG